MSLVALGGTTVIAGTLLFVGCVLRASRALCALALDKGSTCRVKKEREAGVQDMPHPKLASQSLAK